MKSVKGNDQIDDHDNEATDIGVDNDPINGVNIVVDIDQNDGHENIAGDAYHNDKAINHWNEIFIKSL